MKLITTILFLLCLPFSLSAGIVNNSGSTPADSVCIPFFVLDSVGNMTTLASGDSISLVVFYPSGSVAYNGSVADNDASITSSTNLGYTSYSMKAAVADIDGSGKDGLYSYMLVVKDNTSSALATPQAGQFQLYQGADFDSRLDEIADIIDTLQNQDNWGATSANQSTLLSRTADIEDSSNAILDTLQNLDDWGATSANQSTLFSNQVSLSADHTILLNRTDDIEDSCNAILDSLQAGVELGSSSISSMVDATWDELQSGHTTAGSFGRYLDAEISGVGSGTGAYSFQVIAYDSSSGQVVPGVSLALRNIDQTALIGTGRTSSVGVSAFNLDADDYSIVATAPGYLFKPFDTVSVAGAGVDTVKGYPFDPGSPSSPSLCRVWGYLYDVSGVPQTNGEVTASLPAGVGRQGSLLISPFQVSTASDSIGYFYLDLIPSDSLTPIGSLYEITVVMPGGTVLRKRLTIPDSSDWQLAW